MVRKMVVASNGNDDCGEGCNSELLVRKMVMVMIMRRRKTRNM